MGKKDKLGLMLRSSVGLFVLVTYLPSAILASEDSLEKAGDIIQLIIPATAFGTTFFLDDTEGRSQFLKAFLTNLGVTYSLKYAVNKKRPNGGDHSFPAGHASAAFQGAAYIHLRYGWLYAVPAYLGASFVAYSRVASENHYPEDVLAGAAIGMLSSLLFTSSYKGWSVAPMVGNGFYSLRIYRSW